MGQPQIALEINITKERIRKLRKLTVSQVRRMGKTLPIFEGTLNLLRFVSGFESFSNLTITPFAMCHSLQGILLVASLFNCFGGGVSACV